MAESTSRWSLGASPEGPQLHPTTTRIDIAADTRIGRAILRLARLGLTGGTLPESLAALTLAFALALAFKGRWISKLALSLALGLPILPVARLQLWLIDPWLLRLGRLRGGRRQERWGDRRCAAATRSSDL